MSDALGAAQAFSVTAHETRDQAGPNGQVKQVSVVRESVVRRPDRFYFKSSGDVDNEGWYDGKGLTLVAHKEKVYAQARMPETLDRTLDAISERYGIPLPQADFLYSKPAHTLLSETVKGGLVGREDVDGQSCDHVAFQDRGVNYATSRCA
jgi:hypothetical protein